MIEADNTWALFAIIAAIAAAAIWLEQRFRWASRITGCVIALLIALFLSNIGVIPTEAQAYDFVWDYVVPMAIAKGWEPLIVPAILVGTLGYVLGNYYGVFVGIMLGLHLGRCLNGIGRTGTIPGTNVDGAFPP